MGQKKKAVSKALKVAGVVVPLATEYLPRVADFISDQVPNAVEKRQTLVSVPNLCVDGYLLTREQAEEQLRSKGLGATFVKSTVSDARIKYHKYSDGLIIGTNPKANTKVEPGSIIKVKYISQETIDRSAQMYKEAEERKRAAVQKKQAKKEQHKKQRSQVATGIKNGIGRVQAPFTKKFVMVEPDKREEK